jgi:hypothetical protein
MPKNTDPCLSLHLKIAFLQVDMVSWLESYRLYLHLCLCFQSFIYLHASPVSLSPTFFIRMGLIDILQLILGCVMSYFILKHIITICTQRPHGNSTATLYPSGKDNTEDTLSLNLTRLVELPAPERRDSGMIRY